MLLQLIHICHCLNRLTSDWCFENNRHWLTFQSADSATNHLNAYIVSAITTVHTTTSKVVIIETVTFAYVHKLSSEKKYLKKQGTLPERVEVVIEILIQRMDYIKHFQMIMIHYTTTNSHSQTAILAACCFISPHGFAFSWLVPWSLLHSHWLVVAYFCIFAFIISWKCKVWNVMSTSKMENHLSIFVSHFRRKHLATPTFLFCPKNAFWSRPTKI